MITRPNAKADPGRPAARSAPLFARVLCGIDGSPGAQEAAGQAAVLADRGSVELVSVTWTTGAGPTRMTALGEPRARRALESAAALAGEHKARVEIELVHSGDAAATLLRRAADHDLIAVGAHIGSRAGGIMLGSVASRMVHDAHVPVLVARLPPEGSTFPDRVLLASDGSDSSTRAAMLAAGIAGRLGSEVLVLRVGTDATAAERHEVARQTAELMEATGREPVVVERDRHPHETIVEVAQAERVSLVVLGSRGHSGVRALASTSERVAHEAPCSVLVARS